jgi:HAD superfamily hydrolase (TIGR01549 family)
MRVGYIFDLDGTLVDSSAQIGRSANRVRLEEGYAPLGQNEILKLIGLPASELFSDLSISESDIVILISEFREELRKEISIGNTEYGDALEFVTELHLNGVHTAVATSKPTDLAELVVENSKYKGLFDKISGIGIYNPKPDPGVILEVVRSASLENAVMFGDRPEDMIAAKRAGIVAVGIAQTAFSRDELLLSGADKVFNSFQELSSAIDSSGGTKNEFFF